ncbi:LCP family protein [Sphaerisporangium sp. B11E5]|uniref:LCP family protein n=1 Tax=Sphaerisporangium sp. B11E5 TaxID=3153563 RepID=UPI00325C7F3D
MAGDRPGTPDEVGAGEATRAVRRPAGGGAPDPWAVPPGGRGDAYAAGQPAYRAPAGSGRGHGDIGADPTVRGVLPDEAPPFASPGDDGARGRSRVYGKPRSGGSPVRPLPGGGGPRPPDQPVRGGGPRRPRRTGRIVLRGVAVLVVLLIVLGVGGFFWINSRLRTIDALTDYDGRPAATPGEDWLLVGSDTRAGLTAAQRRKLATGKTAGKRTDTMMLLHVPAGDGRPTLVSLPRDSYVPIDGHGSDKLNAAYSFGGPKLLARTVEKVTGIRLDHYMEIGFGGFVGIVDAVGGVNICVKQNIDDPKAGINLKKGCQDMDGGTALGYVRTRKTGNIPDFDRTQRQRQFFSAVVKKAASPGVLANPFRSVPLAVSATDSVAVDPGTGAFDLLSLGLAMSGDPVTTAVPIGSLPTVNGAAVVKWDTQRALRLFDSLAADKPVPKDVLSK